MTSCTSLQNRFSIKQSLKHCLAVCAFGAVLALPAQARAQDGAEGTLAFGVERLFGLSRTNTDTEGSDTGVTRLSLLYDGPPGGDPYSRPRLALDYFVIDQLSLGGSLGLSIWSGDDDDDSDANDPSGSGFLLAPRVGYFIEVGDGFALWPRGGLTFVRDRVENGDGDGATDTATALSLQLPFVITVADGLAVNLELGLDLGLGGEIDRDGQPDIDQEHDSFGLQFGLVGFF